MGRRLGTFLLVLLLAPAIALGDEPARIALSVSPEEGTVGDLLEVLLELDLPADVRFEPPPLGSALGPLAVVSGSWDGPRDVGSRRVWRWSGQVVSYRTGEFNLPPVRLAVEDVAGTRTELETPERTIRVRSVLEPASAGESAAEIADIKPPASMPRDYDWLPAVGALTLGLLLLSALLWWLHRRYASKLAAVPIADDLFQRTPPHVWVYAELQRLLDQRLAENGEVDRFFSELARILKRYLGGRYRVALMERTTDEVPADLRQAVAPEQAVASLGELLRRCDRVKFAHDLPDPAVCREAIETAYRIVDATKPAEEPVAAARGAA